VIFAACLFLTIAALLYIFWVPMNLGASPAKTRLAYLRERKEVIYDNLRDLNFEYKVGKFPESDYHAMKAGMEEEAANLLAEIAALERYPQSPHALPVADDKRVNL